MKRLITEALERSNVVCNNNGGGGAMSGGVVGSKRPGEDGEEDPAKRVKL